MLEALNLGGGGINALLRHAAAAVLNATAYCEWYPATADFVIDGVNAAYASGDADPIEELKNLLDHLNNLGNILDQNGGGGMDC